jgi:hypothetical protein
VLVVAHPASNMAQAIKPATPRDKTKLVFVRDVLAKKTFKFFLI